MTLQQLNSFSPTSLREELMRCCGSRTWVNGMFLRFPITSVDLLLLAADEVWKECLAEDWREAFDNHPQIGERKDLEKRFGTTKDWAGDEQKGTLQAAAATLDRLSVLNREYEKRFGFIFIVCATGKSAEEMLRLLESRITNDPEVEIQVAMEEQNKITKLRLQKLLS